MVVVNGAVRHFERLANVEYLAVVVLVRVVSVAEAFAREACANVWAQDKLGAVWQLVECAFHLHTKWDELNLVSLSVV